MPSAICESILSLLEFQHAAARDTCANFSDLQLPARQKVTLALGLLQATHLMHSGGQSLYDLPTQMSERDISVLQRHCLHRLRVFCPRRTLAR